MRETVQVTELGQGRGLRILMLPGLGNRGAGFLSLARALSGQACPVIVEYPEGHYAGVGARTLARQVREAVGSADAVIASSFGGMVAGYLAAERFVRGVALIGSFTSTHHLGWRRPLFSLMGPVAMIGGPSVLLASVAANRFISKELAPDVVPTTSGERTGVWHRAFAVPRESSGAELRDVPVRCVALHGSHDLIVPVSTLARLAASLPPGSRTHVVEGAGHVPYLTHVDECVQVLAPWLSGLADEAAHRPAA